MQRIKVTSGILAVGAGMRLLLDDKQAARRAPYLDRDGDGYVAKVPLQFKAGETLAVSDVAALGKAQLERFELVDQDSLALDAPKPPRGRGR